jgi:LuxR family transcriptional regulator, glucitol operon activator
MNAGRLTLFALISALEDDFRSLVRYQVIPARGGEILGETARQEARQRWEKDGSAADVSDAHLLYYVDFPALYQYLNGARSDLPAEVAKRIREGTEILDRIAAIRNRIAHTRPLWPDDLAVTLDFCRSLATGQEGYWPQLSATLERLRRDPGFVLELDLTPILEEDSISHNLPLPDFDETGFYGREETRRQLKKKILGPWPVISVLAEGGVGKSALTVKALYELIDEHGTNLPFDSIVWITSKTTQLGPTEIRQIRGAITDSIGLLDAIAEHLAGSASHDTSMSEVLEYLEEFNILLILDNLETVLDDRLREFISDLPQGSKIVTTSRTGIGAFENPLHLQDLEEAEAIGLLRAAARIESVESLVAVPNKVLANYVRRMHLNPAFIKWFVSAVGVGQPPEEVLAQNSDLLLDFCLSNVYGFLSQEARDLLKVFQAAPGQHSQAELAYLAEAADIGQLKLALLELVSANMLELHTTADGNSFMSTYDLSPLSRDYLRRHHRLRSLDLELVTKRRQQLASLGETLDAADPYDFFGVTIISHAVIPVARLLRDALRAIGAKRFAEAEDLVERARQLHGDYFEVHRVDAYLAAEQGEIERAREAYESAIELAPRVAPLRVWYAGFLLRYVDDSQDAATQLRKAVELDQVATTPRLELSRCLMYSHRYTESLSVLDEVISARLEGQMARKYWDLRLQNLLRMADSACASNDYDSVAINLGRLLDEFESVPVEHRDVRIRERLQKGAVVAQRSRSRGVVPSDAGNELNRLGRLLSERGTIHASAPIGEQVSGSIARLVTDRMFGFISLDSGHEAFFHKSNLSNPYYWSELEAGAKVQCVVHDTAKGLAADHVDLLD